AGLEVEEVEHLLWDRLLHRELVRSGKQVIVDKVPSNVLMWQRLARAWPAARFIFLLRHPASVLASALEAGPDRDRAELTAPVVSPLVDRCRPRPRCPSSCCHSAPPGTTRPVLPSASRRRQRPRHLASRLSCPACCLSAVVGCPLS